jgi:D-threo-aldose 1-dehydrogenase
MSEGSSIERRGLGRTGLTVTTVGFGGSSIGNLGRAVDDETAAQAVEAAWNGGIRYFDTAPHYGLGLSERRLGQALKGRPRDQYTLSTKVGRLLAPNPAPTGSDLDSGGFAVDDTLHRVRDYSRDGVLRSLESSLGRLGVDRLDIVYIHDPEDHMEAALGKAVPALVELRDQGVVSAIGAGMNFTEPLRRFVNETDVDVIMVAGRWTLIDNSAAQLLEDCAAGGVAAVAAAPFNSGLLSRQHPADDAQYDYGPAPQQILTKARQLAEICAAHGTTLPCAALQFPLRHPAVVSVVAGMRTSGQAAGNLQWAASDIDEPTWTALADPAGSISDRRF